MSSPYASNEAPPYASHRTSQAYDYTAPPPPPPKPNSGDVSRQSTPSIPPRPTSYQNPADRPSPPTPGTPSLPQHQHQPQHVEADPGPNWLPKVLEDKSIQDLQEILKNPRLLDASAHAPSTAHPSTLSSSKTVQAALSSNIALAQHVSEFSKQLADQRTQTSAQLLATHALERQWRQKQSEMDRALSEYSPSSLYQRMGAGVGEQEAVCRAMEESFVDGDERNGGGKVGERELQDWVRRYRAERERYYGRREKKERWDEGRVGGWR